MNTTRKVNTYFFIILAASILLAMTVNHVSHAQTPTISQPTVTQTPTGTSPQLDGFAAIMKLLSEILLGGSPGGTITTPTVTPPGGLTATPTIPPLNPSGTIADCSAFNDLPLKAQCIVTQIMSKCTDGIVPGGTGALCLNAVTALRADTKTYMIGNANIPADDGNPQGLQCVGLAYGLTNEFYNAIPISGGNNQLACQKGVSANGYRFFPFTGEPPVPGDLIIWTHASKICDQSHPGHIAYVLAVPGNGDNILIAEANWGVRNKVQTSYARQSDRKDYTLGYLRR